MLKVKTNEDVNVKHQSLVLYFILGLIAIISFALTYMVTLPGGPGNTVRSVTSQRDRNENEAAQQAVLQWMKKNSGMPEQVLAKIYSVAMESFNADLILAVCLVESNFNPHVESSKGAIGLMGVMPRVWLEELETHGIVSGKDDLFGISTNIDAGTYVLQRYLEKTGNLQDALSRYAGGDPSYAARVMQMLREINTTRRSQQKLALAAVPDESPGD